VRHNWRRRIQGWAGAFLLFVIVGHVAATRGASFFYGVFPGFEGLSFSLWWIPTYFYPYYLLLGSFGFYHATNGLMTLARRRGLGVPWQAQVTASVIMTALVGLALLSMGGAFFDIANPVDNDYARLFEQLFGIELQ